LHGGYCQSFGLVAPYASNPLLFLGFWREALVAAVRPEGKVADLANLGGDRADASAEQLSQQDKCIVKLVGLRSDDIWRAAGVVETKTGRALNVRNLRRELKRGRRWRGCWVVEVESNVGKMFNVVRLPLTDAVITRVLEERLRRCLEPLLPVESVGLVRGSSLQRKMLELADFVRKNQEWSACRFDVSKFFESLSPALALEALQGLGVHDDVVASLNSFYFVNGRHFDGIGRGLPFAPLLGAAVLLKVFRAVETHVEKVVWLGDDFLCLDSNRSSVKRAQETAHDVLLSLGLLPNRKKEYLGPVSGVWEFAGFRFCRGRAHPTHEATDRLIVKVDEAVATGNYNSAERIMAGWVGQYKPAADSPAIASVSGILTARHGARIPSLLELMKKTTARAAGKGKAAPRKGSGRPNKKPSTIPSYRRSKSPLPLVLTRAVVPVASANSGLTRTCSAVPVAARPGTAPSGNTQALDVPLGRCQHELNRVRSNRTWAEGLREVLGMHVAAGRVSKREGARCIRRAVRRARWAIKAMRKGRYKSLKSRWWAHMRDGQLLDYSGTSATSIDYSAILPDNKIR
jgi:Reverse transcriptase (RNA-dependent DNA polymerase)